MVSFLFCLLYLLHCLTEILNNSRFFDVIYFADAKQASNGPSRSESGGASSSSSSSMGGAPGGLGGLFAGGMPKLKPAGERRPPGGIFTDFHAIFLNLEYN